MYRTEDFDKIKLNIQKIKDDATIYYKNLYEPTLIEIASVYSRIKNYIIQKEKIVYGGFAQNLLLTTKNPSISFYKEINGVYFNLPDIADIEFYSTDPLKDIIDLTNDLYTHGFKHIEAIEGTHPETYKIYVNLINYCDISYMSPNIYNNLPVINVNNFICTHPHFMLVDVYRILTDPMTSYWRLDKSIYRFQRLLKYYPIDKMDINKKINFENNNSENILKYIRKKIIQRSKLILIGFEAFNYYSKKESNNNLSSNYLNNIQYYEIISGDYNKDRKHIYKHLIHKFKDNITIKEYNPFFTFMDKKIEYYYNNKLILRLYSNNYRCTVYNYSSKKNIHYGTFTLVLMYLLFNYYYATCNKDIYNINIYYILFCKLFYIRQRYLDKHNITIVDKSPFQDFTFKCYGIPLDPLRNILLENKNIKQKFKYTPNNKEIQNIKLEFKNSSGNQI